MKRLIIHLKKVDKVIVNVKGKNKKKIFNTLNLTISNEIDLNQHLFIHGDNVKSFKISNFK